ncbi:gliding motility protein [Streptomyces sp. NBC_00859]|uniref:gliding motility protein n=1 Tax=Streptomyces sp. NBC_00859 TaxID=2903682 RepID=UPI003863AECD|nr:gliding motility protein [Streptomyces sp. NBC_00859]
MSIFAVFRRKTKDVVAESDGDTRVDDAPAQDPAPDDSTGEPSADVSLEDSGAGVEIPRQQSAAAAADNEAGEGVRK